MCVCVMSLINYDLCMAAAKLVPFEDKCIAPCIQTRPCDQNSLNTDIHIDCHFVCADCQMTTGYCAEGGVCCCNPRI